MYIECILYSSPKATARYARTERSQYCRVQKACELLGVFSWKRVKKLFYFEMLNFKALLLMGERLVSMSEK